MHNKAKGILPHSKTSAGHSMVQEGSETAVRTTVWNSQLGAFTTPYAGFFK